MTDTVAADPAPSFDRNQFGGERDLLVEHMSLSYSGVHAVRDVTFGVRTGELVGLIGPNGAGKTSLIDAITGYARRAVGEVSLGDRQLHSLRAHRRARAGLVRTFQNLEIFNDLTVAENVEVAGWSSSRRDNGGAAIELLGLGSVCDMVANSLSQGDRRLVALARAMACQPLVLVLDEPAAGLDTGESQHLGGTLRQLVSTGMGMLLVDHDMSLVLTVCDRILVLDYGRLIAEGSPEEIRANEQVRKAYLGG
jgi:ABC-type branched-subunit amino acid transport system ATPase component